MQKKLLMIAGLIAHFFFLTSYSFAADAKSNLLPLTQDFTKPEPQESFPGGAATHQKRINKDAFSQGSANLNFEREMNFKIGNGFFKRIWVSAPASTKTADGLGPLFNSRSCQSCHIKDGRGHPPMSSEEDASSLFLRLSIPPQNKLDQEKLKSYRVAVIPEPMYGTQLQNFAIQGHKAEGQMQIKYQEVPIQFADGEKISLRKPTYSIRDLNYGPLHPQVMLSPRIASPMIGLGLLEMIAEKDILALADPEDKNRDGISGKPNQVWSDLHNKVMLGRFGWKAGMPSINEQSQAASAGDMGISVPLHPKGSGECTEKQVRCQQAPDGNSSEYENLEAHSTINDLIVFYASNLAVPMRRNVDNTEVLKGKKLFYENGCVGCHQPKYLTQKSSKHPEQSEQLIWPYTDLLLHDMGDGLADNRPESAATGNEWRTPPLWGIGLTETVNGHTLFLHDGRARSINEAIVWHGGEAEKSKQSFLKMNKQQRDQLVQFVESL